MSGLGREPIKVISKCQSFLRNMNLCRSSALRIGGVVIPNSVGFTIYSIPLIQFVAMQITTAYQIGFHGFQENVNVFFISLGSSQLLSIYLCLVNKNGKIIETVHQIQSVVDRSKSLLLLLNTKIFLNLCSKLNFCNCSLKDADRLLRPTATMNCMRRNVQSSR